MKGSSYFYTIAGGVLLLIVIFFVGKSYGKNTPPGKIAEPEDIPGKTQTKFDPGPLTDRLFSNIDGIANLLMGRDMAPWEELNSLSDTDFVKVLNDWNKRYFTKWNQSLYQAFQKEFFDIGAKSLNESLSKRFQKLK